MELEKSSSFLIDSSNSGPSTSAFTNLWVKMACKCSFQMLDSHLLCWCVDWLCEQPVFHQKHLLPAHGHPRREGERGTVNIQHHLLPVDPSFLHGIGHVLLHPQSHLVQCVLAPLCRHKRHRGLADVIRQCCQSRDQRPCCATSGQTHSQVWNWTWQLEFLNYLTQNKCR